MEVTGPPGAHPTFSGGTLSEVRAGLYRGRFQPVNGDLRIDDQVLGNCQTTKKLLGVLEVTRPAVFRSGPSSDFDRLTPITPGVRLEVVQRQGDYYQVQNPPGWLKVSEGSLLDVSASLGNPQLTQIVVRPTGLKLSLGSPCAWQVRQDVEQHKLWLDLPGVPSALFHIAYAQGDRRLPSVRVWSTPQGSTVEIPMRQRVWGYNTRWTGRDLLLDVTPAPPPTLRGLRVTLDAGHGGQDQGTVGLELKVNEKDLNLAVAKALQKELEQAGAAVTMTRSQDHQVAAETAPADQELQARVDFAERHQAQLFLSIHHNARPDIKDGRISHGTHVYYYQPAGRGLAQAIAPRLARAIGEPSFMHLWRSFAVIRQTSMPAVLVECNFLSNPLLERGMLRGPQYPVKAAHGIRLGVEQFLRKDL